MIVVLWGDHLIEAQGYTVEDSNLYQENKGDILMEKNGRYLITNIKNT